MKTFNFRPVVPIILLVNIIFLTSSCDKINPFNSDKQLIEEAESLTYLSENFPPYNYGQTGSMNGVAVDILELIFERTEVNLNQANIELSDWTSAYDRVLTEDATVLFSMVRNDNRENEFKWVGPIAPHKEVIISQAGMGIKINSDEDLNQYVIGVVEGYPSKFLLLDKGVDPGNIIAYPSAEALYQAMLNFDVRCISYSEQANNLILAGMGEDPQYFQIVYTIHVDQLYYAFNKSVSNNLINYFQDALDEISNDKGIDGSSTVEKILDKYSVILHEASDLTDEMVVALVDRTAEDLETDFSGTVSKINNQESPYRDSEYPSLDSFVYDLDLTIIAHAGNSSIVGVNFAGKPDASGKLFRDEIKAGALKDGTGWVDYIYTKPDKTGLFRKTTYYKLITASNGSQYIVCSGRYK
jgi:polar amino acid transport system substrate-binding protein